MSQLSHVEPGRDVLVRVPATSANLGPGYDSLGLALGLHDDLRVSITGDSGVHVSISGEGERELPRDETHLCARIISDFFTAVGYQTPGLKLEAVNRIPHGRGLGSSAAAVVSAVVAANQLLPVQSRLDPPALLRFCAAVEGHPDNVAPALFGSLAISWSDGASFSTASAAVCPQISMVVAIPAGQLSTASARALLPAVVPHATAAENGGRTALLVHALCSDPSLLVPATEDRLHQSYRAAAMPQSASLMHQLRDRGHAAIISGAGPTVAAFARSPEEADGIEAEISAHCGSLLAERSDALNSAAGSAQLWRVLRLKVDMEGARVEEHRR